MEVALSWYPTHTRVVGESPQSSALRTRLAAALARAVSGSPSPAKELARRLGLSPNGAALLLRGDSMPRADTLLAACREFDQVWAEVQALARREPCDAERLLDEMSALLEARQR